VFQQVDLVPPFTETVPLRYPLGQRPMTEGVLVVLILVTGSAVLAVQVISAIRAWRRLKKLPASPPLAPTNFGHSFDAVGDFFRGLTGWFFYVLVGLVALFGIIWVIKRMWEAA
jgi:hypothetical protein